MRALFRRVGLVVAVGVAAAGFGLAHASSAQADVYTVCGYGVVVPVPGGGSCMSLPAAITAAQASSGADTIKMLPGDYCPIDLEGNFFSPIKFVGVGYAGVDVSGGPVVFDGPEASLTTFVYNEAFCGSGPTAVVEVNGFVNSGVPFTFENLTVDGSGGGGIGVYSPGGQANLTLRDVIVENVTGLPHSGVLFAAGALDFNQFSSLEIDNSAILNNYNGIVAQSGNDSIYDTTIAGNHGTALSLSNGFDSISGDTIAHNTIGVTPPDFNFQVVDTIVANNVQNCSSINDWEFPPADSWNNLLESQNEGCQKFDATDTVVPSIPMPAVGLNGGPTPSILPPSAADAHGAAPCGLFGVDQREFLTSGSCDVGSVQESANGVPNVSAAPLALGDVDTGAHTNGTVSVQSTGGDLVGISSISISGTGWAIANDGCTYTLLTHASNQTFCQIGLTVTPAANGEDDGSLTVNTTAGTLHVDLTSNGVTRSTGQDDTYDVTGSSLTVPAPGVLGNDEAGAGIDEVVTQPSHGVLSGPFGDGSFTYTPNDAFVGNDSFQYTVIKGEETESHPITVTLHVVGYTVSLDSDSAYSTGPGGSFTVGVTVSPAHGFTGSVCLDVADSNGNTWPSFLSPHNGFTDCAVTDENTGANVLLSGGPVTVHLPIDVASNATPAAYALEILAAAESAPTVASTFELSVGDVNPPVISGFDPVNVGVGTTVHIHGSAFLGTTSVKFNGTEASSFTVVSDSEIDAHVAPGTTSGKITVTTPLGTSTSPDPYTFFAAPTITSLSVTEAAVGDTVIVNGTSLNGATSVTLDGTHVPFTVVTSAEITFTVPAGTFEGQVAVITPGGSATSVLSVSPDALPTITSVSPGSGPVGTLVTITGTNLSTTLGVEIGGTLTVPTSVSNTQVVFAIPPGAASGTIRILARNGSATSVAIFTVTG